MSLSFESCINKLEELRISGERKSEEILTIGHHLLDNNNYTSKIGDEIWLIYEQVITAAIDLGELDFAKELLLKVGQKFPDSARFTRLCGMSLEGEGRFEEAILLYNNLLNDIETHLPTLKRRIAINKTVGNIKETIIGLNDYLKLNPMDMEAWKELSNIYIDDNKYLEASHCIEELILFEPQNFIYHLKYAEILYTLEHFHLALKSYCKVVELSKNHLRGFYGIKMCVKKLLNSKEPKDSKLLKDLDILAVKQIIEKYSKENATKEMKSIMELFIKN
ncbi:TPR-like protein [Neoconidiobolus thromboides FSU 785]|nr:TPR-like protein [Neoconidiobolus thromboides FSU 785]